MKNIFNSHYVVAFLISIWLVFGAASGVEAREKALPFHDDAEQFGFEGNSKVDDKDLSSMRGGLQVGDLHFDFVIITQTMIDGVIQQSSIVQSQGQGVVGAIITPDATSSGDVADQNVAQNIDMQNLSAVLNNVIQSGAGNSVNPNNLTSDAALMTVIQNSNDNAVIQQFNQLDLTVSNFQAIQNANILQQMNFEAIKSLQ